MVLFLRVSCDFQLIVLINRFSWLPVTEDVDEAPFVYGFLADLVEGNNPHILGANNSNLPRVIAVIAEALAVEALPPDHAARQRIINIVKQVQVKEDLLKYGILKH